MTYTTFGESSDNKKMHLSYKIVLVSHTRGAIGTKPMTIRTMLEEYNCYYCITVYCVSYVYLSTRLFSLDIVSPYTSAKMQMYKSKSQLSCPAHDLLLLYYT